MTDRGRKRGERGTDGGRIRDEIERDERDAAVRRSESETLSPPMTAIYATDPAGENRERIGCFGFDELARGVALCDEAGDRIAYVPHENLLVVEPK